MAENKTYRATAAVEPDACEQLELQRQRLMDRYRRAAERISEHNADKDPDEELAFITEVVEEVRQEQYERAKAQAKNGR